MLPISRRIDGLIIMSLPLTNGDAERIRSNRLQTILVEYNHPFFSSIEIDNEYGGRLAAEYLLGKGYRCMAFIGEAGAPPYSLHPSAFRLPGFQHSCCLTERPNRRRRSSPVPISSQWEF